MSKDKKNNTFAVLGLIFGLLFYPLGLVFSIIALIQISKSGERGKGLAIAGIVVVPVIILIIFLLWVFINSMIANRLFISFII